MARLKRLLEVLVIQLIGFVVPMGKAPLAAAG